MVTSPFWTAVLFNQGICNVGLYLTSAVIGQLLFHLHRFAVGEIPLAFTRRTLAAVLSNAGFAVTVVAYKDMATMLAGEALFMGLATGLVMDAIVNRGKRKVLENGVKHE